MQYLPEKTVYMVVEIRGQLKVDFDNGDMKQFETLGEAVHYTNEEHHREYTIYKCIPIAKKTILSHFTNIQATAAKETAEKIADNARETVEKFIKAICDEPLDEQRVLEAKEKMIEYSKN